MKKLLCWGMPAAAIILGLCLSGNAQETRKVSFESKEAISGWTVSGDVSIDSARDRSGGEGGSLKVAPGAKAVWTLRDSDGTGKVEMHVYDDGSKPKDPKQRRVGPRWGLIQKDGHVVVVGVIYAPYLAGETNYTTSDSDQRSWFNVQYLRVERKAGWHKWTFDFDPAKGLTISCDDKKTTFDWNRTKLEGFVGVAVFGDASKDEQQTVWVDDVSVALAGAATTKPLAPPPPPLVVPEKDPAAEKPVELVPAVKDKHPRLLFSAEDVPAMKEKAKGAGKPFFEMMEKYLPACKAPTERKYQTDATDGQRQGFWRLPTVALHYVLTGEKKSFDQTVEFMKALMAVDDWEEGAEKNSGMSAANVMIGMALAYDWLYNDLEPNFRESARQCLWRHARWMYYGGHMGRNSGGGYWINDPQNNHRFHRNAGLVLCALAAYSGAPEEQWLLSKVREEVQFIADWLPDDGTTHESPSYMIFGNSHLLLFLQASDRCFGTKFLDLPFSRNNPLFRLEICTPGLRDVFDYGDSGGLGAYNPYLWKLTSQHKLKDEQAALWRMFEQRPTTFEFGWFSMVWLDPSITGGSVDNLPKNMLFPDIGVVVCRDGWGANNAGAMFKCAPYGGHKLNKYRNEHEKKFHYINVAHDDPDAGMFLLYADGAKVAQDDGYSSKKLTSSHNTILVNGKGQKNEGGVWTQPIANTDMTKLAYMVTYKASDDIVIAEGEAAGMYPELDRFRRTFIWVKGSYVLILDDIRAKKPADLAWLVQAKSAAIANNTFTLTGQDANTDVSREFQVASDAQFDSAVVTSTADSHGRSMGLKQIQLKAKAQNWRLATVFDLWGRKIKVTGLMVPTPTDPPAAGKGPVEGSGLTGIMVTGPGFEDTWNWGKSADGTTPTPILGERKGGWTVTVDEKDKAPSGLAEPVGNTVKK